MPEIPVLFQDEWILIVDKPPGITTHPNTYEKPSNTLVKILEKQMGFPVYSVNRLDRPACGIMVFAKTKEAVSRLSEEFRNRNVEKRYLALVRGFIRERISIDDPLTSKYGKEKGEAKSLVIPISSQEIPEPVGRYQTARYSLVEVVLETGRYQQARRHLQGINHPIIGDKLHGDRHHNRYFLTRFKMETLYLRSCDLAFPHPGNEKLRLQAWAGIPDSWKDVFSLLGLPIPPDYQREACCFLFPS